MKKADSIDEKFMRQALKLAGRGLGKVSPNPMVGAVIVKEGKVIGRGTIIVSGFHAEVVALNDAQEDVAGRRCTSLWSRAAITARLPRASMPSSPAK